ncbi:MAG: ribosomal protein S18-alanine N-acetyltransferase [Methanoregula sp.]|jgi:ribosomal-protein-alanine N-acetyltransferase|nr:ribosomal protein S18-alanine N-acetyltransferase [Methanoregula sp.]
MIRHRELASYQPAQIRRATPLDILSIAAIERELFVDPWELSIFLEALTYYPSSYFVAVCEWRVVGFVVGGLEDTGENIYGHLCNLGVTVPYQYRGIGRLLVNRIEHQFALELAAGVQLEVRSTNIGAQQFYRRLGYRDVFRLAHYYSNDEDAVVMMKWFRF